MQTLPYFYIPIISAINEEIYRKPKPMTLNSLMGGTAVALGFIGTGAVIGSLLFPASVVDITFGAAGMAFIGVIYAIARGILICWKSSWAEHYFELAKNTSDSKEKFKYSKLAADYGHTETQVEFGGDYHNQATEASDAKEKEKSYQQAFDYYYLAAEKGHMQAQFAVGNAYEKGLGVKPNCAEAFEYYLLAARQGSTDAHCQIAYLYYNGYGVEKDNEQASFHATLVQNKNLKACELLVLMEKRDLWRQEQKKLKKTKDTFL